MTPYEGTWPDTQPTPSPAVTEGQAEALAVEVWGEYRVMILDTTDKPYQGNHRSAEEAERSNFWEATGRFAESEPDRIVWLEQRTVTDWSTDLAAHLAAHPEGTGGLTEGETAEILAALGWQWEPSDAENIPSPEDCFAEAGGVIERLLADRAARGAGAGDADLDQALEERDEAQEWADRLAYAIAPQEVIGEHSSGNNPWQNALDYAGQRPDETHGNNHAPLPNGVLLDPGYCDDCDTIRAALAAVRDQADDGLAGRVATALRTLDDLLRAIWSDRYRYERVHVEADLTYLRALLADAPTEAPS